MNQKGWLILFFTDFLLDILSIMFNFEETRIVTKSLLVPLLIVWFMVSSAGTISPRYFIIAALLFSWLGDILLLNDQKDQLYFIAGLSCFLIAHIFYILFFLQVRKRGATKKKWNPMVLSAVALYILAFYLLLLPHLTGLKIPVLFYALVIGTMLITAIHTRSGLSVIAGIWLITGAVLFVSSDSLLGLDKFYQSFPQAGVAIMLTYGMAQFAIAKGSLLYLAEEKKSAAGQKPS